MCLAAGNCVGNFLFFFAKASADSGINNVAAVVSTLFSPETPAF
jgi:hypothetical protein